MTFLAPWWVPLVAGAMTLPPLLLLYFLKLKRRRVPIASTLLWKRAVQDLQVNSPFQRLRSNLLLILQLLILLLAIIALSEPMWAGVRGEGKVSILLIDRSASMSAREADDKTRLQVAKEEARKFIDNLRADDRAMIIAFADRAHVAATLTSDKERLRKAIDAIEQSESSGRLTEAMRLAEAPLSEVVPEGREDNPLKSAEYVVFTDGRLADTDSVRIQRGTMSLVRIGEAAGNVGIVALDIRRHYEQPELVSILARARNFGHEKVTRDVTLFIDGDMKAVRSVELAPFGASDRLGRMKLEGIPAEESEATVPFDLSLSTSARIEVRLSGQDPLSVDDVGYGVIPPPRAITALLVTEGNRFLRQAIAALPLQGHEVMTPSEYENAPEEKLVLDGRSRYDVVVFDMHSTSRLPPGSYVFFGAAPLIEGVEVGPLVENRSFLDWDETHPILRHVAVEAMHVFSWYEMTLPQNAVKLIEGPGGPVVSLLNRERNQYLICAFSIFDAGRTHLNTGWVFDEGFVVFMHQAARYLSGGGTTGAIAGTLLKPGQAFTVPVKPGTRSASVRRPDGRSESVPVGSSNLLTYGQTDRVGMYTVAEAVPGEDARAVNLEDQQESFIAPNEDFRIAAGEQVAALEGVDRVNRPLWPYLLAALACVLFLEWFVYNKRVFV